MKLVKEFLCKFCHTDNWIFVWNKAIAITLFGLSCSVVACFMTLADEIELAWFFVIIAGICDLLDGLVARRLQLNDTEKQFGAQIDTVVDMASFGVVPAIIVVLLNDNSILAIIIAAIYILCVAMRLAFFNVAGLSTDTDTGIEIESVDESESADVQLTGGCQFYTGLPVTYAALIFPLIYLICYQLQDVVLPRIMLFVMVVLSACYVRKIRVPKPVGIWYVLFPIVAMVIGGLLIVFRVSS